MKSEYLNNKKFESAIIRFQSAKTEKLKYELLSEDIAFHKCTSKNSNPTLFIPEDQPNRSEIEYIEAQQELAKAIHMLSQHIVRYARFSHIDEDDAVQEGVIICFERVDKFNPLKGKAFNYMTTCILNHYRQLYRSAKAHQDLKKKIMEMYQIKNQTFPRKGKDKANNADRL